MYRFNAEDPGQSLYTPTTVDVIGALTCLPFAPRDNNYYKTVSQIWEVVGTSSFCPFGNVLRVLLAQIVLGSDYSGSVKELQ